MKRESEDKAERVLSIYSRLKEGKTIKKTEESNAYGVAPRTIQRDIADIQNFLQNQNSETGEIQQVAFDKEAGGYRLETKVKNQLEPEEYLAVCKVLLESRALVKTEMFPIINKMLNACGESEEKQLLNDFIRNEMHHFTELHHGKKLLDRLWKLEKAVKEQRYIQIRYKKMKNSMEVTRKVKPVGVMFSEFYFYLTAFIEDIDKEKEFQNPDDIFPTIYRVDRLEKIEILDEHFSVPYAERFEEGEFRKRIQFMYGGRLRRVKFKYSGESIEAILDRLPTAEILREKDGVYTVSAEVFGKGVDMWLRSQGDFIEKE
ncbi:hypothetical protein C818_00232 [Lachnospiraceae bacterium MD308]|nr:hypothetical protein C818_00232 [Lachnospiraceae bacterium MD308]